MLATVLRGKLAEQQSIFIMRTFREMRHYIRQNQQFVTRNEMDLLTAKVGTITETVSYTHLLKIRNGKAVCRWKKNYI